MTHVVCLHSILISGVTGQLHLRYYLRETIEKKSPKKGRTPTYEISLYLWAELAGNVCFIFINGNRSTV
uniref:Putative secreted protein n=1 Tax=Anopheles darlingi TaxID=43151 RepID=A0A2M4DFM7_ANODA